MNVPSVMLWGFIATVVLSTIIAGAWGLGLSRMSMTFLVGSMFAPGREPAKRIGLLVHTLNGWAFAFIYAAAFEAIGDATWWIGAFFGLVHSLFVLAVAMPLLPSIHPRMASMHHGPGAVRMLQPPGFMALHYGRRTPEVSVVAHLIYGAILGGFYQLAG